LKKKKEVRGREDTERPERREKGKIKNCTGEPFEEETQRRRRRSERGKRCLQIRIKTERQSLTPKGKVWHLMVQKKGT